LSPCLQKPERVTGARNPWPAGRSVQMLAGAKEKDAGDECMNGIAERRKRSEARRAARRRSVLIVPGKQGNLS